MISHNKELDFKAHAIPSFHFGNENKLLRSQLVCVGTFVYLFVFTVGPGNA